MYPEPSVPFYRVLSVYIPLLLIAYLAAYATLTVVVGCVRPISSLLHRQARDRQAIPATT